MDYSTDSWSTISKIVYKRTYARPLPGGGTENWGDTVERFIAGNVKGFDVPEEEINKLRYYAGNVKSLPAGRGIWFSGVDAHDRIGGAATVNCWFLSGDNWENIVVAQDLLMLGGGVGFSVEHQFISKLPKVKTGVKVVNRESKDADFIVPDSREGWNELTRKVLESYFITGKSFSYSTVCIRGRGEPIKGFGGKASGPLPLIEFVNKITAILSSREGKHLRSIDVSDIICAVGEMVVAGNVRRSAIIVIGDPWDKDFLRAKRWDLGPIPTQRSRANFSVVVEDVDDLHPLYWETYYHGEAFGLINRKNLQKYGRMGHRKKDTAIGVNPCGEIGLESGEPCNLVEHFLPHFKNVEEFADAARVFHRYAKRVTLQHFHNKDIEKIVRKNMRVGHGITGCLQSPLFNERDLDYVYRVIEKEDEIVSKEYGVGKSIKLTTVKPSGTLSLLGGTTPGIHPGFSRYYIRRIRFASNDAILLSLREAGYHIEPEIKFDGSLSEDTMVVDFPAFTPEGVPVADEDWDTWKQLEVVKQAQRWWSDNSVSVTVYYRREDIPAIKEWLRNNLDELKTISFLAHNDHGFKQAPIEAIDEQTYENMVKGLKPIKMETIQSGEVEISDCEGGACPVK